MRSSGSRFFLERPVVTDFARRSRTSRKMTPVSRSQRLLQGRVTRCRASGAGSATAIGGAPSAPNSLRHHAISGSQITWACGKELTRPRPHTSNQYRLPLDAPRRDERASSLPAKVHRSRAARVLQKFVRLRGERVPYEDHTRDEAEWGARRARKERLELTRTKSRPVATTPTISCQSSHTRKGNRQTPTPRRC